MNNIKFISYVPDWDQSYINVWRKNDTTKYLFGELHVPGHDPIMYQFYNQEQPEMSYLLEDIFVTSEGEIFRVYSDYVVLDLFNESQAFKFFTILGFSNVQFEYPTMETYLENFQC